MVTGHSYPETLLQRLRPLTLLGALLKGSHSTSPLPGTQCLLVPATFLSLPIKILLPRTFPRRWLLDWSSVVSFPGILLCGSWFRSSLRKTLSLRFITLTTHYLRNSMWGIQVSLKYTSLVDSKCIMVLENKLEMILYLILWIYYVSYKNNEIV